MFLLRFFSFHSHSTNTMLRVVARMKYESHLARRRFRQEVRKQQQGPGKRLRLSYPGTARRLHRQENLNHLGRISWGGNKPQSGIILDHDFGSYRQVWVHSVLRVLSVDPNRSDELKSITVRFWTTSMRTVFEIRDTSTTQYRYLPTGNCRPSTRNPATFSVMI